MTKGVGPVPEEALRDALPSAGAEEIIQFLQQLRRVSIDGRLRTSSTTTSSSSTTTPAPSPAPGPPGPPAPPYVPDLTPPPTPSGVAVTAGLNYVFITTDAPTFSEGHGYARTIVYGATYGGTGPLPTFGDAVVVHEFVGQVGSFSAEMGVQWHVWLKWLSIDGVLSTSPQGGANGNQVTTALLGNQHLGPLLVEAANLANGSVTASAIAAGAIGLTAFASGLRPVRVLGSLPTLPASGYLDGDTALLTTDGKLYRIVSGAWTRALDGADLVASSVTAGAIAAGAVTATQIAAGAITTDKLLVTGRGAALNDDPAFTDASAWALYSGSAGSFITINYGAVGNTTVRSAATGSWYNSRRIAVDPSKTYRVRCRARNSSGNGFFYAGVALFDSSDSNIAGDGAQWFYAASGVVPSTSDWSTYTGEFGAGTAKPLPSNARTMAALTILNFAGSSGYMEAQDLRIEEKAGADLIVDGSIVATKLAANAIAVGTAAIQNGAIVNAMIADATIGDAKIVSLSASKIVAGSIAVGEYIQSSGFTPGGVGFRIDGGGGVEARFSGGTRVFHLGASGSDPILRAGAAFEVLANGSATFSGTVTASSIVGSTVTGGTITGSVIQTATSGQRVTVNEGGSNEAKFYGDRGDGTIEQLAGIGINTVGSDITIGLFGSINSTRLGLMALAGGTLPALQAQSVSGQAIFASTTNVGGAAVLINNYGASTLSAGVESFSNSGTGLRGWTASYRGVSGIATGAGTGVVGESVSGYGAVFTGSNLAPLFLTTIDNTALPSGAAPGSLAMIRFPAIGGGGGNVRLCYIDQFGVWRYVSGDAAV